MNCITCLSYCDLSSRSFNGLLYFTFLHSVWTPKLAKFETQRKVKTLVTVTWRVSCYFINVCDEVLIVSILVATSHRRNQLALNHLTFLYQWHVCVRLCVCVFSVYVCVCLVYVCECVFNACVSVCLMRVCVWSWLVLCLCGHQLFSPLVSPARRSGWQGKSTKIEFGVRLEINHLSYLNVVSPWKILQVNRFSLATTNV